MNDYYLSHAELLEAAARYAADFPHEAAATFAIADHACVNEFIIPYTNNLDVWIPLGEPVDWLHNPAHDPEFTWGINRHWHMTDLGKAYLMSGKPEYVQTFVRHFRSWRTQNPVPSGLAYEDAVFFQKPGPWRLLEDGLRVQSWISAYKYMEGSPLLTPEFTTEFLQGLEEHADYLTRYFGKTEINHAIMHMQGLFMIATFYPWHHRAPFWRQLAMERLELCLLHQVGSEGVQSELTTHYHNASIEMFGTPYLLGRVSGHPFTVWYGEQLRRMAAFTRALIRPDQQSTAAGDSDWVSHGGQRLTLLGALLEDDGLIGSGAGSSEVLWLLGAKKYEHFLQLQATHTAPAVSQAFPQTGYYIMRDEQQYLFFDAAGMGGAHGHADALNVEWMWNKQLFFTDTGRYTYEEGPWRHYFKSTRAHNTVTVDGMDQTPYVSTQEWGSPEAEVVTHRWESNGQYHFIDASHNGYARLSDPVQHRRWLLLGADVPLMLMVDWLEGQEQHELEQRFQLHPAAKVGQIGKGPEDLSATVFFPASSIKLDLKWKTGGVDAGEFAIGEETGWISEIYGSKEETCVLAGKGSFTGQAGVMTVGLPSLLSEEGAPLCLSAFDIDPKEQRVKLSYTYNHRAGSLIIDSNTVQWNYPD